MSNEIVKVLMRRDCMSRDEAIDALRDARKLIDEGMDPEEVLLVEFGLECDYIFDLLY